MSLRIAQGLNSTQLTTLARSKAARECNRPEHDLRLLLAHIKMLDQLEHSSAQMTTQTERATQQRPSHQRRESAKPTEVDELEELFTSTSTIPTAPSLVTVEEIDEDDWDT